MFWGGVRYFKKGCYTVIVILKYIPIFPLFLSARGEVRFLKKECDTEIYTPVAPFFGLLGRGDQKVSSFTFSGDNFFERLIFAPVVYRLNVISS